MADASTTRYGIVKPEVGASNDTWGAKLNTDMDDLDALLGAITTTGSANAYVLTTGLSLAAYVAGQSFDIKASFSNTSTATINVDALGAKAITKNGTTVLASGDIVSGNIYRISYDGTQFQLVGATATGAYQPLDALLTAIAALTTADDRMLDFTGVDTVAVVSYATVVTNLAALTTATGAQLTASNIFTSTNTLSNAAPTLRWYESGAAADTKYWDIFISGGALFWRCVNDGYSSASTYLTVTRSGVTPLVASFDACDLRIAAAPTILATNSAGFRGLPQNIQDANYTAVIGDSGGHIYHTSATPHTHTIPANASVAYPIGHTLTFINRGSGAVTIAITTDTLNWRGSTGSRTLAQYGRATAVKITATAWDIDGNAYIS